MPPAGGRVKGDILFRKREYPLWNPKRKAFIASEQLEELQTALPNTEMYLAARGEPTGSTWREHPHYFEMRDFFGMYYMAGGTNGVDENGNQIIITG